MESSRKQRWRQLQSVFEPGFSRMLLISLLLHILLPVLYFTPLFPKSAPLKPPVYRVNLVNKPVKNPQAGRPEATATQKPAPPKPKPKPAVKPKPIPPKPKPEPPKPKPKPKPEPPKPKPKPAVKPKPEPKPSVSKAQENALQKRLEQLRKKTAQQQAEAERKARLEALRAAAAAESQLIDSPVKDAPVGMLDGKGDEAGVAAAEFVREYVQQQWSLSQYQVSGRPEAEVLMFYSASGTLQHYRFLKKSGSSIFDESLTKAITKSKQLNQPLPEAMEFQIVFNLKEMMDRR
jgi:outer membrane biosynthesis protein TonB